MIGCADRVGADADQAERAEELDLADLRREAFGVAWRDRRAQRVFGPQVDARRRARLAVSCSQANAARRRLDSVPPRMQRGRQHVDLADEVGDERRRRALVDLARRADLLDPPVIHHHDAVGHRQRFFLVVRHHDRGHAELLLQRADLAAQPHALERIERRQRLVEQQQARRRGQRARERDALLLAAGKLARILRARCRAARPASAARPRAPSISARPLRRLTRP